MMAATSSKHDALSPLDRWMTWERRIQDAQATGNMRIVACIARDQLREIDFLIQTGCDGDSGMSRDQLLLLYRDVNEVYRKAIIADPLRSMPHVSTSFVAPDPTITIGGLDAHQALTAKDFENIVSSCIKTSVLSEKDPQNQPVLRLLKSPGASTRAATDGAGSRTSPFSNRTADTRHDARPAMPSGGPDAFGRPGGRDQAHGDDHRHKRVRYDPPRDHNPHRPPQQQQHNQHHNQQRQHTQQSNEDGNKDGARDRPLGGPTSFKTARQQLSIDQKKLGGRGGGGSSSSGDGGGGERHSGGRGGRGGNFGHDRNGESDDGRHNYYSNGQQQSNRGGRAAGGLGLARPQRRSNNPQYQVPVKRSDSSHTDAGGRSTGSHGTSTDGGGAETQSEKSLKGVEDKLVELIKNEIMDHDPGVTWDDVAGLELAKETIQETLIWPMMNPKLFEGLRSGFKGLLLFGPPGTGKTLIGKCIASQCASTFFCISASSLTSKWVGEGEKLVRTLFAVARDHLPAVIFIDEIDSLLTKRSEEENEGSRRIKTEFLVQVDGANTSKSEPLLIVGATNRPQELDEAARRRLAKRVYIALPTAAAREQMVTRLLRDCRNSISAAEMQEIVKRSDGYSGSDLANLCKDAALGPLRAYGCLVRANPRCLRVGNFLVPYSLGALMRGSGGSKNFSNITVEEVPPVTITDFDGAFTRVRASVHQSELDAYVSWNEQFGSGA